MENSTVMETTTVHEDIGNIYNYSDYYDFFLVNEESMYKDRHIVIPIILITVIVLSLIGNILVVVISVFCMRLRSLTSIFILNLALSDLLFTIGLVLIVCQIIWGLIYGDTACKLGTFILSAGFYSSIVFLVLMSVQRYVTVVHPHTAWKKGRCFTHVLICVWMMSILAAVPVSVHTVGQLYSGFCSFSNKTALLSTTYKVNIVFVCAFLFMAFCYIRILQTIFKSPTNQKHRTTGLTFLLVATFFICWAPFNIVMFLLTLNHYSVTFSTQNAFFIYLLLACTRCCLNPVIYGLFGLIFRKTAREIFQRRPALNSAQMEIKERHYDSYVNVNNQ